jgi:chromate transporter
MSTFPFALPAFLHRTHIGIVPIGASHPAAIPAPPRTRSVAADVADTPADVSMTQLLLAYLKLGAMSIGGRSSSYLCDELVERRHWLKREDWVEGLMLGWVLPGPVGGSCAMFLATRLRGSRAAVPALAMYVIPGLIIGLVLSFLMFGLPRPPWANGAVFALSASAFGLFVFTALRQLPGTRKSRLGPLVLVAAFVAHGLLAVDILPVLLIVGGISLALNRPTSPATSKAKE